MAFPLKFGIPEYDAAVEEIDRLDDRGAAIVATALMEEHLLAAIKTKFLQSDPQVEGEFLKGYGPVASLKARIDLGFLLGFYNIGCRARMIRIKEVRNKFAHSLRPLSFDHQEIKDICQHIPTLDEMAEPWIENLELVQKAIDSGAGERHPHIDVVWLKNMNNIFATFYRAAPRTNRSRFVVYTNVRTAALIAIAGGKQDLDIFQKQLMHL